MADADVSNARYLLGADASAAPVHACDVLVAEASGSTYGVGFEVGYIVGRAPLTGQRAVVLYDARREHAVSRMLSGNTAARLAFTVSRMAQARSRSKWGDREVPWKESRIQTRELPTVIFHKCAPAWHLKAPLMAFKIR